MAKLIPAKRTSPSQCRHHPRNGDHKRTLYSGDIRATPVVFRTISQTRERD
jgi:hypothetical protein